MSDCKCDRKQVLAAYEALQLQNYGKALEILWRVLGFDNPKR